MRAAVDEELSIGDYVVSGGEIAALVVIDAVARFVPGVLGCAQSAEDESFRAHLLEYPQYTRPPEFRGERVPEILLSGDHQAIARWRRQRSPAPHLGAPAGSARARRAERGGSRVPRHVEANVATAPLRRRLGRGVRRRPSGAERAALQGFDMRG